MASEKTSKTGYSQDNPWANKEIVDSKIYKENKYTKEGEPGILSPDELKTVE